ncbi:MAG: hypothetical protein P4L79_03420 [Legionella sp.]|uniref:tetratricopeptide repeat protein n=1 Tax=Legionella sp. TaxID=459 RepID=UPI00283C9106|nr:hypothetical protein [Legionella sp.]
MATTQLLNSAEIKAGHKAYNQKNFKEALRHYENCLKGYPKTLPRRNKTAYYEDLIYILGEIAITCTEYIIDEYPTTLRREDALKFLKKAKSTYDEIEHIAEAQEIDGRVAEIFDLCQQAEQKINPPKVNVAANAKKRKHASTVIQLDSDEEEPARKKTKTPQAAPSSSSPSLDVLISIASEATSSLEASTATLSHVINPVAMPSPTITSNGAPRQRKNPFPSAAESSSSISIRTTESVSTTSSSSFSPAIPRQITSSLPIATESASISITTSRQVTSSQSMDVDVAIEIPRPGNNSLSRTANSLSSVSTAAPIQENAQAMNVDTSVAIPRSTRPIPVVATSAVITATETSAQSMDVDVAIATPRQVDRSLTRTADSLSSVPTAALIQTNTQPMNVNRSVEIPRPSSATPVATLSVIAVTSANNPLPRAVSLPAAGAPRPINTPPAPVQQQPAPAQRQPAALVSQQGLFRQPSALPAHTITTNAPKLSEKMAYQSAGNMGAFIQTMKSIADSIPQNSKKLAELLAVIADFYYFFDQVSPSDELKKLLSGSLNFRARLDANILQIDPTIPNILARRQIFLRSLSTLMFTNCTDNLPNAPIPIAEAKNYFLDILDKEIAAFTHINTPVFDEMAEKLCDYFIMKTTQLNIAGEWTLLFNQSFRKTYEEHKKPNQMAAVQEHGPAPTL